MITNVYEGLMLGNRYRIKRLLGQGGMADVYLASDLMENMDVAIKILKAEFSTDAEFLRRFESEARAVSSLSHPNIVQVFGIGEENGIHYMVMEYIKGITLKELLQQCVRLDWDAAVPIAIQIGLALEHAHRKGIIHRDIKPQNIMITPDVKAKVTDFGIARASSVNTITMTGGGALGSVHYFSPEQARGGMVGEKSDIYSLGILLYELVTGALPFDGDTSVSIAIKHLQENPQLPSVLQPSLPAGLDGIIMKCIQKSTEKRYNGASDLVSELDALMIDPDGEYGIMDHSADVPGTLKVSPVRQSPDYRKVGQIESTMNERRRSRRRDLIIVLALVVVAGIALANIGIIAVNAFRNKIPVQTSSEFEVGNYIGKTIVEATAILKSAGFSAVTDYKVEYVFDDTVLVDHIVRQVPAAGAIIKPGGLTILTLYVSGGQDMVKLENYAGQNYLTARTQLETTLGFVVTVKSENSELFGKDQIIRTAPAAGQLVPKGSEIVIYVSNGKARVKIPKEIIGIARNMMPAKLAEWMLVEGSIIVTPNARLLPIEQQVAIACMPAVDTEVETLTAVIITYGTPDELFGVLNPTPTPDPLATTVPTTAAPTTAAPTTAAPTTAAPTTAKPTAAPTTAATTAPTTAAPTTAATTPSTAAPTPTPKP